MNAGWIIPFIVIGGALQSCGAAMNGQLNKYVVNPWLASTISFALITFFFVSASVKMPHHGHESERPFSGPPHNRNVGQ
jgi:bacterial/archaeal transporter family-2 protein